MYHDTINKIRNEMPYEIRMNMFLIRCNELNNYLCDLCEELINIILSEISDHVFVQLATKITQNLRSI